MGCVRSFKTSGLLVVNIATPLLTFPLPILVRPSRKATWPPLIGVPGLSPFTTVAVKVTESPRKDGFSDDISVVVVGCALVASVKLIHQPPLTVPVCPGWRSTTNSCQVPLALAPPNSPSMVLTPRGAAESKGFGAGWETVTPLHTADWQ